MTEGYQNVTVTQHVITEHGDPPRTETWNQADRIHSKEYTIKFWVLPAAWCSASLNLQGSRSVIMSRALGVSERQPARNWKPGHSSRNICPPSHPCELTPPPTGYNQYYYKPLSACFLLFVCLDPVKLDLYFATRWYQTHKTQNEPDKLQNMLDDADLQRDANKHWTTLHDTNQLE